MYIDPKISEFIGAVIADDTGKVEQLIKNGIDIHCVEDEIKITALHHAAHLNLIDMVELLVKHGANIHALDESNETPLDYAKTANAHEVVAYLEKITISNNG